MGNKKNTTEDNKKDNKKCVVFDINFGPKDYNMQVLTKYANESGVDPIIIGIEMGELHSHMISSCKSPEQEARIIGLWNRLLDFYIEAGTWNGSKKAVKFRFRNMTEMARNELEKEIIKVSTENKKRKSPSYSG